MRKMIARCVLFFLWPLVSWAQTRKGVVDSAMLSKTVLYFQPEYTLDASTEPAKWERQQPGLHASFASTNEVYYRSEVPELKNETQQFDGVAWKGERLNTMVVLWSPDTIGQVRFELSDLKDAKGNVIPKKNIGVDLVRYVLSNDPLGAGDVYCGESQMGKTYLLPDRLEKFERFDLPGHSVRPIWLSFNIPATVAAGVYQGAIKLKSEKQSLTMNVSIKVQNQVLAPPHAWKFRLDIWQNPSMVAIYFGVKPWSAEHMTLLKKHLQLYADAGGKFITANVVPSVWADDTYLSLVDWTRTASGSWKFDYRHFDQYVTLAMETGVDKAITIYSPIPYGEAFRFRDEKTGNEITENWSPTSTAFTKNWTIFLADLKSHLEKKGWFDKTYIGINENGPEQTMAAIKMVKDQSKTWKITYAGDWHAGLDTLLSDFCSIYGKEPTVEEIQQRTLQHRTSTFYVCCTPPKPNNFIFSPPAEGTWMGWYAFAHHYDGFLRWAYDTWPPDVIHDARNSHWNGPAGDCFMVYPGANSSVRFEKLREGIVDYEKLRIVKQKALASSNTRIKELLGQLDQQMRSLNQEKNFEEEKIKADVTNGKKLLDQISDIL